MFSMASMELLGIWIESASVLFMFCVFMLFHMGHMIDIMMFMDHLHVC
jgi:hypothetical protein